ncbi:MAG: recombination mediator RecR [Candidatus Moranbacteria bacterium]|nr:recombination mediator RecR [Candidatus Moranbacteria bacterium]MDD5652205.1 recombination mediator RecR [Candidatus Moranbacteria bacterium]MDX9855760.1 recombination mediator RecR [Candidatus Moranbacteria bacterium]
MYPKIFQKLIDNFSSLPSIGPKMAERLVLFLFKQNKEKIKDFSENLAKLKELRYCERCFNISEENLCEICNNKQREDDAICVVEDPLDIISIERTGIYKGLYHVLGGSMEAGEEKNDLKIPELLERLKKEGIKEIIIATNPTTEGDMTSLYLKRKLQNFKIKITRLGRGLSTGGDIEYADELTLSSALTNREKLN